MNYQYLPVLFLILFLGASYYLGYTPLLLPATFIVVGLMTYILYAKDKSAAQNGDWRVPESTLHIFSLFCGWPGAVIAQQTLRHKTKKISFRATFWLTLMVNVGVLFWVHTADGSSYYRSQMYKIEHLVIHKLGSSELTSITLFLTRFRPEYVGQLN